MLYPLLVWDGEGQRTANKQARPLPRRHLSSFDNILYGRQGLLKICMLGMIQYNYIDTTTDFNRLGSRISGHIRSMTISLQKIGECNFVTKEGCSSIQPVSAEEQPRPMCWNGKWVVAKISKHACLAGCAAIQLLLAAVPVSASAKGRDG